jgi:hypothetical protein
MTWWILGGVAVALLVVMWFRATNTEDRQLVGRPQRVPPYRRHA